MARSWALVSGAWVMATAALCACATAPASNPLPAQADLAAVQFVDLRGGAHQLGELRGQVVLLDFWATWCDPCVASLPLYNAWQRELGGRGLVVVAASVDEDGAAVEDFASRNAPELTVWRDPAGSAAARLGLPKMPTAFLIGRDGALLARHAGFDAAGAEALREQIVAALGAP